jgi:spermidine/putrescine transport system permease protein
MQKSRSPWLLAPAVLWMLCFFLMPLAIVVAVSFASRKGVNVEWVWTTKGWEDAFKDIHLKIFWRTLWYALQTTGYCLLIGLPMAFFIHQRPAKIRNILYALVLVPLVANSLSLVYAWKTLLFEEGLIGQYLGKLHIGPEGNGIYNTGWASLLGMIYYYLPFMIYPVYTSLDKLDARLLEASADLGATPSQSFWHVTVPLIWPGIGSGSVMVFIQTLGTFVIPDILAGNKEMLMGTLVNQKFVGAAANWPLGAALSLLMLTVIAVALLIYFRMQDKLAGEASSAK